MKNTVYTKEQVNAAILKVITTQFKKDAKEAHEIVKEAGYEIVKEAGSFEVFNKATGRRIYLHETYYHTWLHYGWNSTDRTEYKWNEELKFDFVNCLDKPLNKTYWDMKWREVNEVSKSQQQYRRLVEARRCVEMYTKSIADVQKQIERLQQELVCKTESKVKNQVQLENIRKELGLKK